MNQLFNQPCHHNYCFHYRNHFLLVKTIHYEFEAYFNNLIVFLRFYELLHFLDDFLLHFVDFDFNYNTSQGDFQVNNISFGYNQDLLFDKVNFRQSDIFDQSYIFDKVTFLQSDSI